MDTIHRDNEAIKNDMTFVRNSVPILEMGIDALQLDENRQRHDKIMEWISQTNFPARQSDFIASTQEGTGQWFLNSPEFTKWLHGSKETLFCPGIPGAGKTMIAAIVVDHISRSLQSNTIGVAFIYCDYKAQADQNALGLLAAILRQMVQARPSIAEPVACLYRQHGDRGTRPSLEEILSALKLILANYSSVYVIIDALDECLDRDGSRSQLLAKLVDLQRRTDLHLMVTSRFIPDIIEKFRLMLTLEVRASDVDVKRFVAGQICRLPKCIQRDEELQALVRDGVVQAVDGMLVYRALI